MNLIKYARNRYSQSGEDGIIEEIFTRLKISSGWFVEFGAWDGKYLSNTYNLLAHHGWQGVYIEGNPEKYRALLETSATFPGKVHPLCAMVGFEGDNTLDHLLARTPIPKDFALLSIDIDSYDWQVWKALQMYKPKLVIIESNCSIAPGIYSIHNPPVSEGASFTALVQLGKEKGYSLVCHTGNCFFVLNELVSSLNIEPALLATPEKQFNHAKYRKERLIVLARKLLPPGLVGAIFKYRDRRREAAKNIARQKEFAG
jgi:hypothetical protein